MITLILKLKLRGILFFSKMVLHHGHFHSTVYLVVLQDAQLVQEVSVKSVMYSAVDVCHFIYVLTPPSLYLKYCRQYFSESLSCGFKMCRFQHVPVDGDEKVRSESYEYLLRLLVWNMLEPCGSSSFSYIN